MATHELDTLGLKCPQPILKIAIMAKSLASGDMMEVKADCPSFPNDVKAWCERTGNTLLVCADEGGGSFRAQIQF
jgi:TusA-related sulfurtransferase